MRAMPAPADDARIQRRSCLGRNSFRPGLYCFAQGCGPMSGTAGDRVHVLNAHTGQGLSGGSRCDHMPGWTHLSTRGRLAAYSVRDERQSLATILRDKLDEAERAVLRRRGCGGSCFSVGRGCPTGLVSAVWTKSRLCPSIYTGQQRGHPQGVPLQIELSTLSCGFLPLSASCGG